MNSSAGDERSAEEKKSVAFGGAGRWRADCTILQRSLNGRNCLNKEFADYSGAFFFF